VNLFVRILQPNFILKWHNTHFFIVKLSYIDNIFQKIVCHYGNWPTVGIGKYLEKIINRPNMQKDSYELNVTGGPYELFIVDAQ
jgi:hypothetical protein